MRRGPTFFPSECDRCWCGVQMWWRWSRLRLWFAAFGFPDLSDRFLPPFIFGLLPGGTAAGSAVLPSHSPCCSCARGRSIPPKFLGSADILRFRRKFPEPSSWDSFHRFFALVAELLSGACSIRERRTSLYPADRFSDIRSTLLRSSSAVWPLAPAWFGRLSAFSRAASFIVPRRIVHRSW